MVLPTRPHHSIVCFCTSWQDRRNFLRGPPAGVQFHFDSEQMYPVAMVMLEEDELLRKMRFHLVPKEWECFVVYIPAQ